MEEVLWRRAFSASHWVRMLHGRVRGWSRVFLPKFSMIVLHLPSADAPRGFGGFSTVVPLLAGVRIIFILVINTESLMCQVATWGRGGGRQSLTESPRELHSRLRHRITSDSYGSLGK